MTLTPGRQPAITLVDDDLHSARLMTRMLAAHGGPQVELMSDPAAALEALAAMAAPPFSGQCMVIVDLKSSSTATHDFVASLRARISNLLIVAMAPSLDRETRNALLDAGAAAVFERHAELNAYRREAGSIVAYWVRSQRLDAVGT